MERSEWACAFCEWEAKTPEKLANHLITKHSFNVLGKKAPHLYGKRIWYEIGKNNVPEVRCFCGIVYRHRRPIAPFFHEWLANHSGLADHLRKTGGIIKHLEELRIAHAISKIEKVASHKEEFTTECSA